MKDLSTPAFEIRFRPIQPEDEELLYQVYGSTRETELAAVPWGEGEKEAFLRQQFEAQHRWYQENYAGAEFLVILKGGAPAGRLYVVRWDKEIRLIDIALLPEHRNGGVGSAILGQILAEGDARGLPVSIHVERWNPALRLYERLGFAPVEDRGVYLLMRREPRAAQAPQAPEIT
jgi:ribosomal protein S18 acetylase RimI-like enzyme